MLYHMALTHTAVALALAAGLATAPHANLAWPTPPASSHQPGGPLVTSEPEEDSPYWNCRTQGNLICAGDPITGDVF